MNLEQIRKMGDYDINEAIAAIVGTYLPYASDLNAAMSLVPQTGGGGISQFIECLDVVMGVNETHPVLRHWLFECPKKPRALCEAFLLWKAGDK